MSIRSLVVLWSGSRERGREKEGGFARVRVAEPVFLRGAVGWFLPLFLVGV